MILTWKHGIKILIGIAGVFVVASVAYLVVFGGTQQERQEAILIQQKHRECVELFNNSTITSILDSNTLNKDASKITIEKPVNDQSNVRTIIPEDFMQNNPEIKQAFDIADILNERFSHMPVECRSDVLANLEYKVNVAPQELVNLVKADSFLKERYFDEQGVPKDHKITIATSGKYQNSIYDYSIHIYEDDLDMFR